MQEGPPWGGDSPAVCRALQAPLVGLCEVEG